MSDAIRMIRLNNLQYNPNRDPQVYRRLPNQPFRLEVDIVGEGTAKVSFEADGQKEQQTVNLLGRFECQMSFDTPASRVGVLIVDINGDLSERYIRLDVMDHAWGG